ncbi:uncharacterized protein BP5553_10681 [Venustampulla echinocandica]|uniref:NAD(P)-binding protein n=1 Tax=Venustampulla echinocandica TaxID=2656787 RepID=A0A370T8R5_9HELO|nr:uncharacterized protein BP5553_10681 [Venustampulla echinocandica]RDL29816.1 hypothetical protein BP5553_10681 [Venustampulla echinocandica]
MTTRFYKNGGPIDHLASIDLSAVKNGYHFRGSIYVKCNTSSWDDQVAMFETAIAKSPTHKIDIVIANAGVYGPDILDGIENDKPTKPNVGLFDVNLFGVIYTTNLAAFYFHKQEGAPSEKCLILLSSIMGYIDSEGAALFTPTPGMHPTFRDAVLAKFEAHRLVFGHIEDAATAAMCIATQPSINGRSIAIVPREISTSGYLDLNLDDFEDTSVCGKRQKAASSVDYPGVNKY